MIRLAGLLLLSALATAPVSAEVTQGAPATRLSTLVVYGNDPCPRSSDDEIVVCARQPESDRYRIPPKLRKQEYNAARDGSWAGTAQVLENVSRQGIPNSCNPIGSFGQSGCFQKFLEENGRVRSVTAP
ncbi:hypothetical protein Q4F19_06240 [Sphingomonas sp. BIUV-7]|uniref:Uncharacterized protein n=1 Tax=Sphingomonas natans TaxID=3063330 RepID=A0ABT8Y6M5_9SPHN|nr:hypothetical protein [Sphingomonas sp. BIUV-7]MDO6413975.1 hypothetical protein [Sphingomonas sp. BIUV-7]